MNLLNGKARKRIRCVKIFHAGVNFFHKGIGRDGVKLQMALYALWMKWRKENGNDF
jgi:hypothetical protein